MSQLVIGIDPDLQASGVALVREGVIVGLNNLRFFDLIEFINANRQASFVVEDVEANKPTFNRHLRAKANARVSQNVGQVKAVARLITEYLESRGLDYIKVKPLMGQVKIAKKDAAYFNRLTGWENRSNEDNRDAALLALYGRPVTRQPA